MKQHYYFFDFARVVAAIFVLLVHARVEILTPYSLLPAESQTLITKAFFALCSLGTDGVIVFFVLSGFLVGGRNIEKMVRGNGSAMLFAVNRMCRIFPPLILALLFSTMQKFITGDPVDGLNIIGNLLCLQGIAASPEMPVLWTITYEMFFYLLVLSLFLLMKHTTIIGGILLLFLAGLGAMNLRIFFWFPIISGTLFYLCRERINGKKYMTWGSFILGLMALAGEKLSNDSSAVRVLPDYVSYEAVIWFESLCWTVVLVSMSMKQPIGKFASSIESVGVKLSKYSYSLFLCHYPVLRLCRYAIGHSLDVNMKGIMAMLLVCVVCCMVAIGFYHLSEKHSQRLESVILKSSRS